MTMPATVDQIADAAHEAGQRSEEALRRKATQMHKFFDDVEELLRQVSGLADADIARLRNRVESSIDHVRSTARDGVNAAVEGTRTAAVATDRYVRRNPWTAIGVTAALGVLVGVLLHNGRK
jgi:ElaB/YqjD/DUF883 family membrane-anchored ribosome-binding protein